MESPHEKNDTSFTEQVVMNTIKDEKYSESMKKILLMGLSKAGKTCIYERVFEGKKPWELMNSAATKGISYKQVEVSNFSKPTIWDLGGQDQYIEAYHGDLREKIFKEASILLYVVDITDSVRYEKARAELIWAANQIILYGNQPKLFVLFHKIDSIQDKNELIKYTQNFFREGHTFSIDFFATSIFDESLFNAWSEIIRCISPKSTYINKILKELKQSELVTEALLIERNTGLACGSTVDEMNDDLIIGMISLLIVTIDRVSRELKIKEIKELNLKSDNDSILLRKVDKYLILVIILQDSVKSLKNEAVLEIETTISHVISQIQKLYTEQ
jgi:Ras-related GTP-binding protein A/B